MLGAGMMGAAIAYVCAKAGIEVVLKDVSQEAADKRQGLLGELRREGRLARALDRRRRPTRCSRCITADRRPGGGRRRRPRDRGGVRGPGRQGAGLRRDRAAPRRRARCSARTPRRCRSPASPRASRRPDDFIGLHFFSPGRQDAAARDHQGREDERRDARTARSTSPSRSRRRRSSSTTAAASSPAA